MIELLKKRIQRFANWFLLMLVAVSFGTRTSFAITPSVGQPVIFDITQNSARANWTNSVASVSDIWCSNNNRSEDHFLAPSTSNSDSFTHSAYFYGLLPGNSYSCYAEIRYQGGYYASPIKSFWTEQSSFRIINTPTQIPVIINNVVLQPPQPINPTHSNLTATSVSINWTTTTTSDSNIQYYTGPTDAHIVPQPSDDTIDHTIQLNGLRPSTTYSYVVWSTDHAHQVVTSRVNSFTTPGLLLGALLPRDNTPPAIASLRVLPIAQNSATISWVTNEEASDRVYYSTDATDTTLITNYQFNTPAGNFSPLGVRKVSLRGLSPGTTYSFRAVSKDRSENVAISLRGTFTTLSAGSNGSSGATSVNDQNQIQSGGESMTMSEEDAIAARSELLSNDSKSVTASSAAKADFEKTKEAVSKELQKESPRKNSVGSSEFDSLDLFLDNLIVQKPGVALFILFGVIGLVALLIFLLFKKFAKSVVARRVLVGCALLFVLIFILSVSPFISGFIYSLPYYFEKNQNDKALEKTVNKIELKVKTTPKGVQN